MPDEIHSGYLGRLIDINGLPRNSKKALGIIKACAPADFFPGSREPSIVQVLAFAAAMTLPTFVRNHTLLPYRRSIASHKVALAHGDSNDLQMLRYAATRVSRDGAFFCTRCIDEDLAELSCGMSYWRRIHQLPGLYICPTHGEALRYADSHEAFQMPPSQCLSFSSPIHKEWALKVHAHPMVSKFIKLSLMLSNSDRPFQLKFIRYILIWRANNKGLSPYAKRDRKVISDHIVECYPGKWLEVLFPGITTKQNGEVLHPIDSVLYPNTRNLPVSAYLLVICVLLDSTEEAIDLLLKYGEIRVDQTGALSAPVISVR